ncbi:MAG: HDIG domain-containing protein [Armatimonadota bacterium]|nr:HDIG domain-containing protein [bacterium]MDW8321094.1 HDIG domain-containing protein [Armatimonadota bacterium]
MSKRTERQRLRAVFSWLRHRVLPRWDWQRLGIATVTIAVLCLVFSGRFVPDKVTLQVGDVSPREIRAHRTVRYVDVEETSRLQDMAAKQVDTVYEQLPFARVDAQRSVEDAFEAIDRARTMRSPEAIRWLAQQLSFLPVDLVRAAVNLSAAELQKAREVAKAQIDDAMQREIRADTTDLAERKRAVQTACMQKLGQNPTGRLAALVCTQALRPNRVPDLARTEAIRERERRGVPPVYRTLVAGDVVIRRGERVTAQHIEMFTALGMRNPRLHWAGVLAILILVTMLVVLAALHIAHYHPRVYQQPRQLWLISVVVALSALGVKLGSSLLGIPFSGVQLGYLSVMSTTMAGMLLAVLVSPHLATLLVGMLAIQSALLMNGEMRFAAISLMSSLVGIYSVWRLHDRYDLLRAGLWIGATSLLLTWVLGWMNQETIAELSVGSAWAVLMSVLAVGGFAIFAAVLERPFGAVTHLRLLELSSPEHPLLKELMLRAPGTYAHSIMVSHLSDAAAKAIGADSLLARVGSYYHDVGKMRRPEFFIENQRMENVHDRLTPSLSALIIAAHVKDGLELADQHRLPRPIRDIIAQHHGTSLISFFYHQALAGCEMHTPVLEQQFRYSGPKPQSKEAGIVMLADAVEASSRSLSRPTPARIESLVEHIIQEKIADGQLDECSLTFGEVHKIRDAFCRLLIAMLHSRVEYPSSASITHADYDYEPTTAPAETVLDAPGDTPLTAPGRLE